MKPNFRLTTDPDVEISTSTNIEGTSISVNVVLHQHDIETLENIFIEFLSNCERTNEVNVMHQQMYDQTTRP